MKRLLIVIVCCLIAVPSYTASQFIPTCNCPSITGGGFFLGFVCGLCVGGGCGASARVKGRYNTGFNAGCASILSQHSAIAELQKDLKLAESSEFLFWLRGPLLIHFQQLHQKKEATLRDLEHPNPEIPGTPQQTKLLEKRRSSLAELGKRIIAMQEAQAQMNIRGISQQGMPTAMIPDEIFAAHRSGGDSGDGVVLHYMWDQVPPRRPSAVQEGKEALLGTPYPPLEPRIDPRIPRGIPYEEKKDPNDPNQ